MAEKLEYLKLLRTEIINGQKSRNTMIVLKITAMAVLVSYSKAADNPKLIIFAAIIAVILDYVILGISTMIREISQYIISAPIYFTAFAVATKVVTGNNI